MTANAGRGGAALARSLYRAAEVRELDRRLIEEHGTPAIDLMERAAAGALDHARALWPRARRLAVVCGTGNNGGDGLVLARMARALGLHADVVLVGDPARLAPTAAEAGRRLEATGARPDVVAVDASAADVARAMRAVLEPADLVVDGLLGTGLDREVRGAHRAVIDAVNEAGRPVLALDLPSGLHADTGRVLGVAVHAAATITFIALKSGLFTGRARDHTGPVHLDTLGAPPSAHRGLPVAAWLDSFETVRGGLPRRRPAAHKGDLGHVLVIGGDHGYAGAVRLAAEAALRSGAGLVSVATRADHVGAIVSARPEVMVRGVDGPTDLEPLLERATVLAVGPGLGHAPWGRRLLERALVARVPRVVDADGLNLLAERGARAGGEGAPPTVITPHPGEAGRLLGQPTRDVEHDRFAAAAELARRHHAVVVLKGAGTVVQGPGALPAVCADGNPGMASAGMGDVLTGVIAALLAQGLDALAAARVGVCLHGAAGDLAAGDGQAGLLASDLFVPLRGLVDGGRAPAR